MSQETWNQMKKQKKLTIKTILKHFKFCLLQAQDNLGAHKGGPYEDDYRKDIFLAERAYDSLKEYTKKNK